MTKKTKAPKFTDPAATIVEIDLDDEMTQSYMEYALSVISSRSVPDVRDGLKPVHRRLLYAMQKSGLKSSSPHKKSASAVGETIKTFHPHGDSAIYESLVRLAQSWSMRVGLVDGHGNFGSRDHGPAASRYTEARLAKAAESMLEGVTEDTVDMSPNFDSSTLEPTVLPAAFPNLLINGVMGIAVGISTKIPPHNFKESVDACVAYARNSKISLDELMTIIPGPDFPTGGIVYGEGIREMYETGRGSFTLRSKTSIEALTPRKKAIVVTELPYAVGPEKIISEVKKAVSETKIDGITNIEDLSGMSTGLRLVIEIRANADPQRVMALLFKYTSLEVNFSAQMIALKDQRPQTFTLIGLISSFVDHRVEVVRRRCEFRLQKAEARAHLVEGVLKALDKIDLVVKIIRAAKRSEEAKKELKAQLNISEIQAEYILDMPLRRLTSLEGDKLEKELKELEKSIKYYKKILASKAAQVKVVIAELEEVADLYSKELAGDVTEEERYRPSRQTKILKRAPKTVDLSELTTTDGNAPDVSAPEQEVWVAAKGADLLAFTNPAKATGVFDHWIQTSSTSKVVVMTSAGRTVEVSTIELSDRATPLAAYLDMSSDEAIIALLSTENKTETVALMTANGTVKRVTAPSIPSSTAFARAGRDGVALVSLREGDSVVAAAFCGDDSTLCSVTRGGQLLRTESKNVRPQGASAGGMAGMKLKEGDVVVAFAVVKEDADIVLKTDAGNAKQHFVSDYPIKGRGTQGVRCIAFKKADTELVVARIMSTSWAFTDGKAVISETLPESTRDSSGTPASFHAVGLTFDA